MAESVVVAGRVGRPHGLDGSFHVLEAVMALLVPGRSVLVGGRAVEIVARRGSEADPLVRLEGVADREAAQALRGAELEVPREQAPALEDDEYYAADLVGCRVADGPVEVGEVTALVALPSCEALEVAVPGAAEPVLVPLVRDAVRSVDVPGRRIDVDRSFLGL
ncbi:MAG TPA: ribosome maturation factor RimM [Solirubrobacteraceae bacterium]